MQLRQLLREVCGSHVLIMGDFNYPDVDWSSGSVAASVHSSVAEFVHTLEDCFLAQHVLVPTRGDSILDLILTRDPDLVSDVNTLHPLGNSDRNMILFTVHLECDIAVVKKEIRDYKHGDYDTIRSILSDANWNSLMTCTTEECWMHFKELLHSLIADHVPLKVLNSKRVAKKPVWMTHKAFKLIIQQLKQHELCKSRIKFEKRLADNIKHDLKSFYAYSRSKTKCKVQVGPLTTEDGNTIESTAETVTVFNNYFT